VYRLGGTNGAQYEQGIIIFIKGKEMKIINLEQDLFVHHRIVSAIMRVKCVSDGVM
jgi:hypothetical protein